MRPSWQKKCSLLSCVAHQKFSHLFPTKKEGPPKNREITLFTKDTKKDTKFVKFVVEKDQEEEKKKKKRKKKKN